MTDLMTERYLKLVIELYENTPNVEEFDIRTNTYKKRGDMLPAVRERLKEVQAQLQDELYLTQQAVNGF